MKKGLTEIVLVLDRSGSMAATKDDAEGGLREFVKKQRKVEGECQLTFYRFDTVCERVFEARDLKEVLDGDLILEPRGMTALLDSMGRALDEVGERLSKTADEKRPSKVIMVTITDGHENASQAQNTQSVAGKIDHQRDVYGWQFVFIGANQDAIASAAKLNIPMQAAMTQAPTKGGTIAAYAALSHNVAQVRTSGGAYAFSDEDRKKATQS